MLDQGGGVPALKFRSDHWSDKATLEALVAHGWLREANGHYVVQSVVLPLLDAEPAQRLLSTIEGLYAALRGHYRETQDAPVPVSMLVQGTGLSRRDVVAALRVMLDNAGWSAGWTDLDKPDATIKPAEKILEHETYAQLAAEVRGWSARPLYAPAGGVTDGWAEVDLPPPASLEPPVRSSASDGVRRAWPAVRACLEEFSFYDIKSVAGLAGFDVTQAAHLVQESQESWPRASKGLLMTVIDQQVGAMDVRAQTRFLSALIEEIVRRRPQAQDTLSEYLNRLGWSFVNQTLLPLDVFDDSVLADTPAESHGDLVKAVRRWRDGDLGGALSAACAAVDAATYNVYQVRNLGNPADDSFQRRCIKAAAAQGVLIQLDQQLIAQGWSVADAQQFKQNLQQALNQGAYVLQALRSRMADVHGTKPIVRSLVFDALRWAELIVGLLVERPERG